MEPIWPTKQIEDVSEKVGMGPFGSSIKVDTFVAEGVPIISGQHLHGFKLDDSVGYNHITVQHAEKLKGAIVHRGDVVFTHAGNIGQVSLIPENSYYENYILSQRQFFLRCDPQKSDPEYIVAYFKSPEGRHKLLANTSQVGVPSISKPVTYLRSLEIPLPPLPEQRRIAHILGTLDDKIENNRKTAKTLEATAQAIFKSWFVDFDPVRAKMAGESRESICKRLKITPEILDLFPDRLVDSELGEIPEGWLIGNLGNIAKNVRRTITPSSIDQNTAYIALEHMPRQSVALHEWDIADSVESNKFYFRKGEILFGKLRPYFHKVGIASTDGICSTDILVIIPKSTEWLGFSLGHISSKKLIAYANSGSTGTRMPRTNWNELAKYMVVIPTEQLARKLNEIIQTQIEQIIYITHVNRSLKTLRNALLPKLISGEIRVSDAQWMLEEALP